ncbi:Uncharacterised protein [uncultured archaeon]|nr:Uncharacterised protein [uncultured archaeon]
MTTSFQIDELPNEPLIIPRRFYAKKQFDGLYLQASDFICRTDFAYKAGWPRKL